MAERLYDVVEARARLGGIGHSTIFRLLKDGELRSVQIGRRRMIPESEITAFIDRGGTKRG